MTDTPANSDAGHPATGLLDASQQRIAKLASAFGGFWSPADEHKGSVVCELMIFLIHHIIAGSPATSTATPTVAVNLFEDNAALALAALKEYGNLSAPAGPASEKQMQVTLQHLFARIENLAGRPPDTGFAAPELLFKHIQEEQQFVADFGPLQDEKEALCAQLATKHSAGAITDEEYRAITTGIEQHVDALGWKLNDNCEVVFSKPAKMNPNDIKSYRIDRNGQYSSMRLSPMQPAAEPLPPASVSTESSKLSSSGSGCLLTILLYIGISASVLSTVVILITAR